MSKFLVKVVETYRVDTEDEASRLIEEAKESSSYILTKYSSTHKSSKEDEWEKVELTKIFNDEKEPISDVEVTYNKGRFYED